MSPLRNAANLEEVLLACWLRQRAEEAIPHRGAPSPAQILRGAGWTGDVPREDAARIPTQGPAVILTDKTPGPVEFLVLTEFLEARAVPFRLLLDPFFSTALHLEPWTIPTLSLGLPAGQPDAAAASEATRWLLSRGILIASMAHGISWLGTLLETGQFPALPVSPAVLAEAPAALPGAAFELRVGEALPLAHLAGALNTRIESGFLRLRFRALRERHLSAQRLVPRIPRNRANPSAAAGA